MAAIDTSEYPPAGVIIHYNPNNPQESEPRAGPTYAAYSHLTAILWGNHFHGGSFYGSDVFPPPDKSPAIKPSRFKRAIIASI